MRFLYPSALTDRRAWRFRVVAAVTLAGSVVLAVPSSATAEDRRFILPIDLEEGRPAPEMADPPPGSTDSGGSPNTGGPSTGGFPSGGGSPGGGSPGAPPPAGSGPDAAAPQVLDCTPISANHQMSNIEYSRKLSHLMRSEEEGGCGMTLPEALGSRQWPSVKEERYLGRTTPSRCLYWVEYSDETEIYESRPC